jgi:hypothetical protein
LFSAENGEIKSTTAKCLKANSSRNRGLFQRGIDRREFGAEGGAEVTAAMIAGLMPAVIKPYSIAVAR